MLSFFLLLIPFLQIFGRLDNLNPAFENISFGMFYNYGALIFFGLVFVLFPKKFKIELIGIVILLLAMLFMNYAVTDLASGKWLINWLGFIFISLVIVHSIVLLSHREMLALQNQISNMLKPILIIMIVLMTYVWLLNIDAVAFYFFLSHDMIVDLLTRGVGIEKQCLGIFISFPLLAAFCFWRVMSTAAKALFLIALVISLPAILGIRTLILGTTLVGVWYYISMRSMRRAIFFGSSLPLLVVGYMYSTEILDLVQKAYDRFSSLQFALSTLLSNPFGLGNGGYQLFVENNNDVLVALFGSEMIVKNGLFWAAPESDLVYFIASWGVLSIVFFGFFTYFLLRSGNLLRSRDSFLPIEKTFILMSWMMIFMGISQDNAGGLIWWVYMAAGYGVTLRHQRKRLTQAPSPKNLDDSGLLLA